MIHQIKPCIEKNDIEAVTSYLKKGGWLTEFKETKYFENEVAKFVGRKYAIAVPNGTIAIYLALKSLDLGKGSVVAIPNITMIATINAVIWADAEPLLIDVNESLCMSYEALNRLDNIDAVVYVPLNGRTQDGEKIESWCTEKGIHLIEDSAHALGSNYSNKKCGALGDLSILSFTPHKLITTGQGGMILTDNDEFYQFIYALKSFNREQDRLDWHKGFGLNFKFTDFQAVLGSSQLERITELIKIKQNNFNEFKKYLDSKAKVKLLNFLTREIPWFNDCIFESEGQKNKCKERLKKNNIITRDAYPPLNQQGYLKSVKKTELTFSESIASKILWLPSALDLDKDNIKLISNLIH